MNAFETVKIRQLLTESLKQRKPGLSDDFVHILVRDAVPEGLRLEGPKDACINCLEGLLINMEERLHKEGLAAQTRVAA